MTAAIYRLAWLGLVVNLYSPPHILIYPCNVHWPVCCNVSARGTWPGGGGVSLKKASGCLGKLWWRGGAGASGREAAVPQSGGERVTSTSSGHVSSHGPPLTRRFRWVQLDYLWALQYCHTLFEFRIWHCQNCASLLESVRVIVVRNYLNIVLWH